MIKMDQLQDLIATQRNTSRLADDFIRDDYSNFVESPPDSSINVSSNPETKDSSESAESLWKLYHSARPDLPFKDKSENFSWRMMTMENKVKGKQTGDPGSGDSNQNYDVDIDMKDVRNDASDSLNHDTLFTTFIKTPMLNGLDDSRYSPANTKLDTFDFPNDFNKLANDDAVGDFGVKTPDNFSLNNSVNVPVGQLHNGHPSAMPTAIPMAGSGFRGGSDARLNNGAPELNENGFQFTLNPLAIEASGNQMMMHQQQVHSFSLPNDSITLGPSSVLGNQSPFNSSSISTHSRVNSEFGVPTKRVDISNNSNNPMGQTIGDPNSIFNHLNWLNDDASFSPTITPNSLSMGLNSNGPNNSQDHEPLTSNQIASFRSIFSLQNENSITQSSFEDSGMATPSAMTPPTIGRTSLVSSPSNKESASSDNLAQYFKNDISVPALTINTATANYKKKAGSKTASKKKAKKVSTPTSKTASPLSATPKSAAAKGQKNRNSGSSASANSSSLPVTCTNCHTSTTPLWRRNPEGQPLCNACGLFLKLHGIVRPLCLKTDVIKKRQRGAGGTAKSSRRNSSTSNANPPVITDDEDNIGKSVSIKNGGKTSKVKKEKIASSAPSSTSLVSLSSPTSFGVNGTNGNASNGSPSTIRSASTTDISSMNKRVDKPQALKEELDSAMATPLSSTFDITDLKRTGQRESGELSSPDGQNNWEWLLKFR